MGSGSGLCQAIAEERLILFEPELWELWKIMAEQVEALTVNYEEDGMLLVKEIDKEILSKGAWTTVVFRYQEYDKDTGQYGQDKYTIRRYQKRNGQYQVKSKFNISSPGQALKITEVLTRWLQEG